MGSAGYQLTPRLGSAHSNHDGHELIVATLYPLPSPTHRVLRCGEEPLDPLDLAAPSRAEPDRDRLYILAVMNRRGAQRGSAWIFACEKRERGSEIAKEIIHVVEAPESLPSLIHRKVPGNFYFSMKCHICLLFLIMVVAALQRRSQP